MEPPDYEKLATAYLKEDDIENRLGSGKDGIVFSTTRSTAIKFHERDRTYFSEREAYQRLREDGVTTIQGHAVPRLINFRDDLLLIEMSIVKPPFVLDFGGAFLDYPPDFFLVPELRKQWEQEKQEEFGVHWDKAAAIFEELRIRHEVYHADLSPRNVAFS